MKQTIAMKQAAFEELMREHGFQYLGATTYDGKIGRASCRERV